MSGQERRRYPRIDKTIRIRVGRGTGQLATETVNLSCGGALCWLKRPLHSEGMPRGRPARIGRCTIATLRARAFRR